MMHSRQVRWLLICTLALPAIAAVSADAAINVVVPKKLQEDAGLRLATNDLVEALQNASDDKVSVIYRSDSGGLPAGDVILIGRPNKTRDDSRPAATAESFRIRPSSLDDRNGIVVEGETPGLMYGVFRLAERVRLGRSPWDVKLESTPAFPMRMFSEEGQLLDIPDFGYYSDEPPYVDEKRLQVEVDELKRLVDHIVRLGYNTFTILHLSFEEYVDYRYLDKPVYEPGDRHLARSPVFCKCLKELCDYAHARHVDVYLQLYETQFPPRLDKLYRVSLKSQNMERIIQAKIRELFERVPLDGLVITTTETHPRCGYRSKTLWKGAGIPGAGRVATMYHKACKAQGKKAVFRAWRVVSNLSGVRQLIRHVPDDAMLAIKNTGGDYFLNSHTTGVISSDVGKQQPLMVLFDTYRQYDGWSRLFIYMQRWGEIVRDCRAGGVTAINAWGAWSPGCIWPDWEPGYMRDGKGKPQQIKVSWAGRWNDWRMFTRGFTPGQANVYLLGRLAWNPDADVSTIAREFAALHVGAANAEAAAEAMMATEDAWAEEYLPGVHPCYLKWTMIFRGCGQYARMEEAYQKNTLEKVIAGNTRALEHVQRMEAAFAKTKASKAPDAKRYAEFKEGVEKTALYLRTFYLWRQCWWRHRAGQDLKGEAKAANAEALRADKARLMPLFDQWSRWPEEARYWRITFRYGRYVIAPDETAPYWFPRGDKTTMEATAELF